MLDKILKERRKELNFTQQEIADKLNVTRQTVSSWEVGKSIPDISSLIEISELYDLSLDYMLKGDKQVTEQLKKDTLELHFLRFFSKSTLIIMAILLAFIAPIAIILVAGAFIYITVFKKQNIKIITKVEDVKKMKNYPTTLSQVIIEPFSIVGGIFLFFVVASLFYGNKNLIIERENKIFILFFFGATALGRYLRYRKYQKAHLHTAEDDTK